MGAPFRNHADAAFGLLEAHRRGDTTLTRRAGSFVGQLVVDPTPMTDAQYGWLAQLLERAGLPAMEAIDA